MLMYELKFKNLFDVTGKDVNHAKIMQEVLNYENHWFKPLRNKRFYKYFAIAQELASQARGVDISKVELNPNCKIKIPSNIDNISFMAMMELQAMFGNTNEKYMFESMVQAIAIACYSENYSGKYDSNSYRFDMFRSRIMDSNLFDMLGIYNWVDSSLKASVRTWEERFMSVSIEDKDYEMAGGSRMAQFNIVMTIKNICSDFNVTYEDAWQQSYALTQTNSYSKATMNHVQDQMRILKEARMKSERKTKKYT